MKKPTVCPDCGEPLICSLNAEITVVAAASLHTLRAEVIAALYVLDRIGADHARAFRVARRLRDALERAARADSVQEESEGGTSSDEVDT